MRPLAAALVLLLSAAATGAAHAREVDFRQVPLESLQGRLEAQGRVELSTRGIVMEVDGSTVLFLPVTAVELELDVEASGPVVLSWACRVGDLVPRIQGPPWRYTRVPRTRAPVRLDLRISDGWTPAALPVLAFVGAGRVVVHGIRVRPVSEDREAMRDAHDRALRWAPDSVGHTTINTLMRPVWSASRRTSLAEAVAGIGLLAFGGVLAAVRLRGGGLRPGFALATACALAFGAWNAHFLVRFLPMANLSFAADPEARIRDNYYFDPELGAIAALARATLRPGERVATTGTEKDWYRPQVLCFYLAPRRCVMAKSGSKEHLGISGVEKLRPDEIDAIVSVGGPLPDGFVPVASASPRAVVARRR